jgi:hypothetical protein
MLIYMSLHTLRRKSNHNRRIRPISGKGINGFSLNSGHRNHGSIGQFKMISNTTRTPYYRNEALGCGGHHGRYYKTSNRGGGLNSGSCCTNDNNIIKKSSINTKGMIALKYKWMKGTYPNYWVQEDDTESRSGTRNQSTRIENLTKKYGSCVFINPQSSGNCAKNTYEDDYIYSCGGNKKTCSYFIGTRKFVNLFYAKNYNQPPMSQGQYITTGGVSRINCLPTPPKNQPFPMKLNHNNGVSNVGTKTTTAIDTGCQINYNTWEQAKAAGALPPDWTPGTLPPGNYSDLVQRSSNYPNPNVRGTTPNT